MEAESTLSSVQVDLGPAVKTMRAIGSVPELRCVARFSQWNLRNSDSVKQLASDVPAIVRTTHWFTASARGIVPLLTPTPT